MYMGGLLTTKQKLRTMSHSTTSPNRANSCRISSIGVPGTKFPTKIFVHDSNLPGMVEGCSFKTE